MQFWIKKSLKLGQWWSELTVNILGNFGDQLFLVNFYMGITKIWGNQARVDAFGQKWLYFADQNDEKTKFLNELILLFWPNLTQFYSSKVGF